MNKCDMLLLGREAAEQGNSEFPGLGWDTGIL